MNAEQARRIIIRPYITEKIYTKMDREDILAFIVDDKADKASIREAIKILYNIDARDVNTARTVYGKKAYVKFQAGVARDLATKLGLV
ncbi:MAG: 50S ribosomal protein L23 [Candidatus Nitrosocaldus sp.]|nr:50S ribosomal protein L23 [Candidatus Nitrosocaldus sp.]MCS7141090.1 50S ribosomal protein L23 [Candidatus Nitrosocaldus sp.]MDW8000054.1 50S ribosomal protein L23 [Candidatus Nitrosocaldus sp.]MDW8275512.1 50S ribosomal protein L23 [Candidatus Nitrosocaldus sp.]